MSEQTQIVVLSPFRCGRTLVKVKQQLTVGKDVTKSEARSLVSQKKANWIESKVSSKGGNND